MKTSLTLYKEKCWLHVKSGHYYRIVLFAVREADLTPLVIYCRWEGSVHFERTCEEFFDGRFITCEPPPADDEIDGADPVKAPAVGRDANNEAIQAGDYVSLASDTAEDRRAWGPQLRRRIVEVREDHVRLEPVDGNEQHCFWTFDGLKYAGSWKPLGPAKIGLDFDKRSLVPGDVATVYHAHISAGRGDIGDEVLVTDVASDNSMKCFKLKRDEFTAIPGQCLKYSRPSTQEERWKGGVPWHEDSAGRDD